MDKPKGILIPIGGREDKEDSKSILSRIIDETRKHDPRIEIITIATNLPKETVQDYYAAFQGLGFNNIGEIHFEERDEIPAFIDRIKKCDAVLFSGGNQLKITTLLGGTEFLKTLKDRYYQEENFVVAGTSAGAAAMCNTMILKGGSEDALIKGKLQLSIGLDFINDLFIDTHFMERGRFGRLIQTVTANPNVLGMGLSEDTAAVIYNGNEMEIIGSGLAVVADGLSIKYSNISDIEDGNPISVEGVIMHVLCKGQIFSLKERRFLRS